MKAEPYIILVVDDDPDMCRTLQLILERDGYRAIAAHEGAEGLALAASALPSLAIVDYRLPDMTGIDVLRQLRTADPTLPVVLLTGFAEVAIAVTSIKEGAFDYLSKPFDNYYLLRKVREALLCRETSADPLAGAPGTPSDPSRGLSERMGPSPAIARTIQDLERVARTDFAVSLYGETGSGKEVVARAIHAASARAHMPFVAVDCGSIPDTLIENELFGHERGAYTGAERREPGKIEAAQGGTLFLDEIANLSWSAQARLLRVLQERVLYRVGGTKPVSVDVRLVSASNRDLADAVARKSFREDLLYRLCDYRIQIPPLRARREDIMHIAAQFLAEANRELGKSVVGFSTDAEAALLDYAWPGNVRQLRSVVRRAVLLATHLIDTRHLALPEDASDPRTTASATGCADVAALIDGRSLKEIVRLRTADLERQVLQAALKRVRGNKAAVARLLQVDYKTVHTKLKAYGLSA